MNRVIPRLLLACLVSASAFDAAADEVLKARQDAMVRQATSILDTYHGGNRNAGRKLRVICWRPNDREYPADNTERLTRIMKHIQAFYADEMERLGFGRRSIALDLDKKDQLIIYHAVGSAPYADYKKPEGNRVKDDCWPVLKEAGLDPDRETVLIFTNLSDWDPDKLTFFHKSPYYASGSNRRGVAWQLASPELDTKNLPLKKPLIRDGEYGRISLGKHNSIFIGGIAHELGHALGLPHCWGHEEEVAAHGTALMGSGNRTYFDELRGDGKGSFLALASALRLASHPQFSGSVKGLNLPARATFSGINARSQSRGFELSGKVTSAVPVYAVLGYLDPEGGGDYNSRTVCAVPDPEGNFTLNCDQMVTGKPAEIRVFALLANGAVSRWQSSFGVDAKGAADLSMMQAILELGDFVAAVNRKDTTAARKLAEALPDDGQPHTVAQMILAGRAPRRLTISLHDYEKQADSSMLSLSMVEPTEVKVGWGQPVYDYLPRDEVLLTSGTRLFTTGIYAHAPARHAYELPEGHGWKKFSGFCGLPNQRGGSVAFRIVVDGKEVFASPVLEGGQSEHFEVGLSEAGKVELIVDNGGDDNAVDWGYWFDPILSR